MRSARVQIVAHVLLFLLAQLVATWRLDRAQLDSLVRSGVNHRCQLNMWDGERHFFDSLSWPCSVKPFGHLVRSSNFLFRLSGVLREVRYACVTVLWKSSVQPARTRFGRLRIPVRRTAFFFVFISTALFAWRASEAMVQEKISVKWHHIFLFASHRCYHSIAEPARLHVMVLMRNIQRSMSCLASYFVHVVQSIIIEIEVWFNRAQTHRL